MRTEVDIYVIGKVIEMRKAKGIKQQEIADWLEVSKSFIARIESNKYDKKYSVSQLNEIAKLLNCSPKDFQPKQPI